MPDGVKTIGLVKAKMRLVTSNVPELGLLRERILPLLLNIGAVRLWLVRKIIGSV